MNFFTSYLITAIVCILLSNRISACDETIISSDELQFSYFIALIPAFNVFYALILIVGVIKNGWGIR